MGEGPTMSAGDHLSNVQFSNMYTAKLGMGAAYAHNGNALNEHGARNIDNIVGKLVYGIDSFERSGDGDHKIDEVWVHPDYRRAGIATAMLGVARDSGAPVRHSDERTEKGDAWAQKDGAAPVKDHIRWRNHTGDQPG